MTDPARPPARIHLGDEVPTSIRDFVGCRTQEVVLDLADADWLPSTPLGPPTIGYEPSGEPNRGTLTIGLEFAPDPSIGIAIVDGKLELDLGATPDLLSEPITRWVDSLNAQLADNGMELGSSSFADGRLTVTKQPIGADDAEDEAPAVAAPSAPAVPAPDTGGPAPDDEAAGSPSGCTSWILVGAVAAVLAVVAGWVVFGGDDETDVETDQEQVVDEDADDPTDEVEVGRADDPADDPMSGEDDERYLAVTGTRTTAAALCADAEVATGDEAAATGQDPRMSLQGMVPLVDESGTLLTILCFEQPWVEGPPYDLFSLMFGIQVVPVPGDGYWWIQWTWHDQVGEVQAAGPDGEQAVPVTLLPDGYPLVHWRGLTVDDAVQYQLWYQTGSWTPDAAEARYAGNPDDEPIFLSGSFGTVTEDDIEGFDWDISQPGE